MSKQVTAIIERNNEGHYSIYTLETFEKFGLYGYGETQQEAIDDFCAAYKEMKELLPDDVPDIQVVFKRKE